MRIRYVKAFPQQVLSELGGEGEAGGQIAAAGCQGSLESR